MILAASSVELFGAAILISGASGCGKSSLCFELLSHGAQLIADDQTRLCNDAEGKLCASCPPGIHGLIELYGIGIAYNSHTPPELTRVAFEVHLHNEPVERFPEPRFSTYSNVRIPCLHQPARDSSVAAKIRFLAQAFQQDGALPLLSIAKQAA